jgi:prolyl-tRNA synthetase
MYDDRDLTPGSKMKEAQLLGFPFLVIIGKEWTASQKLEVEERETQRKHILSLPEFIQFFKEKLEQKVDQQHLSRTQ